MILPAFSHRVNKAAGGGLVTTICLARLVY